MRLRSISKNLNDQNWFAVFLDFFIVVMGVYIGVQMGNLNDHRKEQRDYKATLERFKVESETNVKTLNKLQAESGGLFERGSRAFDLLLTCDDTSESLEIINSGLMAISGTYGIKMHRTELDALTGSEKLLASQPPELRQRLSDMKYYFDLALYEAKFVEMIPLEERMQNNPIIGIGTIGEGNVTYAGADFSRKQRRLKLKVPVSEACQNDALVKSFYTWERWQGVLPVLSNILKTQIETTLEVIEE